MNKNRHRMIFSQRLGALIAVAETAKARGKRAGQSRGASGDPANVSSFSASRHRALLCATALTGLLALPFAAHAQSAGGAGGELGGVGGTGDGGGGAGGNVSPSNAAPPTGTGAGAAGGSGGSNITGGGGGSGGAVGNQNPSPPVTGTVTGANGSDGAQGFSLNYPGGGGGGGGGAGILVNTGTLTNSGTVSGGTGGVGGNGSYGGGGGGGGAGVLISSATLINAGTISGGSGGKGGDALSGNGGGGGGGSGISGSNAVIVNSGTISGGLGGVPGASGNGAVPGASGANGNAITFTGGINSLQLQAGSVINGAVVGATGTGTSNTLILGGATTQSTNGATPGDTTFDVSQIAPSGSASQQYQNFTAFQKTGTSTWTLTGTTTAVTPWTISAGTLLMGNDNALGAATGVLTVNGGTLDLDGTSQTVGALSGTSGSITSANAGTLTVNQSTSTAYAGTLDGAMALTMQGTGTLTLSGANTYSGGTTISNGTVQVSSDGNLGAAAGALTLDGGTLATTASFNTTRAVTVSGASGDEIDVASGTTLTMNGAVSGVGVLTKTGAGTLVLSNANTGLSNGVAVGAGVLQLTNAQGAGAGPAAILPGGTLDLAFSNATFANSLLTDPSQGAANASAIATVSGGNVTLSGNNAGFAGTLNLASSGSANVASANNLGSGALQFDGGTLHTTANVSTGQSIALTANGGTFQTDAGTTLTASGTLADAVSGTPGALTKTGAGTLALTGAGSSVGAVAVNAGTLSLGQSGAFDAASYTTASGAATSISENSQLTVSGAFTQNTGSTLNLTVGANTPVITADSAALSGTFNLAGISSASQANQVLISTTNGISGNFSAVSVGGFTGTVDYLTLNTGISGNQYLATYGLSWTAGNNLATGTFTLTDASDSFNIDTALGDEAANAATNWNGASLTKAGAGTLILSADNTYTGGTTISAGTLQLGDGGTTGSITGNVANAGTLAFDHSNATTFGGVISGSGAVEQIGTGTTILTAANTYGGGTTISAGTLQLGNGGATGSIAGNVANAGTLAFDRSNAMTFGGVISGSGAVEQIGTGTTTLTAANTYTGGTTISAGTLQLGDGGTTGSITGNVANAGTLAFDRGDATTFGGVISGSGAVEQIGTGTTTLTGAGSSVGAVTVSGGTLAFAQSGAFNAASYTTANSAATSIGSNSQLAVSGAFTQNTGSTLNLTVGANTPAITAGSASLNGTFNLAGISSASQANQVLISTTSGISGNFSAVAVGGFIGTVDYLTLNTGISGNQYLATYGLSWTAGNNLATGTFTLTDANDSFNVGTALGDEAANPATNWNGASLTKAGAGTLILSADNTYGGGTTISAGTLQLGDGGTAGSITGNVENAGTLAFDRGDATTFGGVISGSGAVEQIGTGATTLTGAGSSVGAVTVSGGTLAFSQSGAFNAASITTASGAATSVGANSQLVISGALTQNAGSTLSLAVGSNTPVITADSASLGGTLNLAGISSAAQSNLVLISTANGISGNFSAVTIGGVNGPVDYLTLNTGISGNQYVASYGLSWTAGNNLATGTFTLAGAGDSFNVGTALGDEAANPATNWNGASLTKAGAGTLILSADNTYTGGTTISAGTLQLGDGGTDGSIAGNVSNAGTLAFDRSDATTFNGVISGSGAVEQIGTGTTTLTAANTYSGGTTISAGTLAIAATGGVAGSVLNDATFDNAGAVGGSVTNAANATFLQTSGSVAGGVTNAAGATFTQSGGSVAGGLTNAGTVNANGGALNGAIANDTGGSFTAGGTVTSNSTFDNASGATLAVTGAGSYTLAGLLTNSGTLTVAPGGTLTADGITNAASGIVTNNGMVSGSVTTAGILNNTGTIDGSLTQTAGTVTNTGTVNGGLTQSGGLMINTGSITGAAVFSGGVFTGTGSVGVLTISRGATVAPGVAGVAGTGGIGTMTVAGAVSFAAGSTYQVALDPNTASQIKASGTVTLNGGTVDVLAGSGNYAPATTYTILSASGGVTGTFDGVTSNLAFLTPSLSYDADDAYLTMIRNDVNFADVGDTANQRAVGGGVQSLGSGNALYDAVAQLDASTARTAFNQLAGELHASLKSALTQDSHFVRDAALDRLRDGACGTSGGTRTASTTPDSACNGDDAVSWSRAFGAWGHAAGNGNAADLSRDTGGFLSGVDGTVFDQWRGGLFAGYSYTNLTQQSLSSSGQSDGYTLGLYLGRQWGNLALRTGAAYTWNVLTTDRAVSFQGYSDRLTGSYDSGTAQPFAELGYGVKVGGGTTLEPFANAAYVNLHTDGFTERGGAAALHASGDNTSTTFSTVGLRDTSRFTLGNISATATGLLGWRHAFGDVTPASTLAFASNAGGAGTGNAGSTAAFNIAGMPLARDAAVVDAGIDFAVGGNGSVGLSYNGQFGSGVVDNGVRAEFMIRF